MTHPVLSYIPLTNMTEPQSIELELCKIMSSIREAANESLLRGWLEFSYSRYLVGRLHGYWFGIASRLIWNHPADYSRLQDMFTSFENEAEFLLGQYQGAA